MIKPFSYLFIGVLIFLGKAYAQQPEFIPGLIQKKNFYQGLIQEKMVGRSKTNYFIESNLNGKPLLPLPGREEKQYLPLQQSVQADYHVATLGFMCKKEWQFEKATKIPVRVRLGSLQYCNMLEGKQR